MLEGIRVLSSYLLGQQQSMVDAVADITGEELEDGYGLAADFIYDKDESPKQHLKNLGVKVK